MQRDASFSRRAYWFCQAAGWGLWGAANLIAAAGLVQHEQYARTAALMLCLPLIGVAVSHLVRHYFRRDAWQTRSIASLAARIVWVSLAAALASTAMHTSLSLFCVHAVKGNELKPVGFFVIILMWATLYGLWLIIYTGVHTYARTRQSELLRLEAEAAASEAELRALKMQVNPHFLFNCLNSIRALILVNPDAAQDAVTRLSTILRYSLQSDRRKLVRLDEELEAVADYLCLEQIRFEQRLRSSIEVDEAARAVEIPPMLVQTLVENAIKHGIAKLSEGGEVRLTAACSERGMQLSVVNPGRLEVAGDGTGLGLENARRRLWLLCGAGATLSLGDGDGTVRAEVWIPRCER
jgi:sensor histidine kinase YesM